MEKKHGATLFLVFFICSLVLLLRLSWTYVSAIVLALLLASVFYPLYSWVKRVLRERELLASLSVTFFILLILVIPVGWFIGTLSNEAFDFYQRSSNEVSLKQFQRRYQDCRGTDLSARDRPPDHEVSALKPIRRAGRLF